MKKILLSFLFIFSISQVEAFDDYIYESNWIDINFAKSSITTSDTNGSTIAWGGNLQDVVATYCYDPWSSNSTCFVLATTTTGKMTAGWFDGTNYRILFYSPSIYDIATYRTSNSTVSIYYAGSYYDVDIAPFTLWSPPFSVGSSQTTFYLNFNTSSPEITTKNFNFADLIFPQNSDCTITRTDNILKCTWFYDTSDQLLNISFYTSTGDLVDIPWYLIQYIGGTTLMPPPYNNIPYFFQRQIPSNLPTWLYNWIITDESNNIRGNYQFSVFNSTSWDNPQINTDEENLQNNIDLESVLLDENNDGDVTIYEAITYPFRFLYSILSSIWSFFEKIYSFFSSFSELWRTNEYKKIIDAMVFPIFFETSYADSNIMIDNFDNNLSSHDWLNSLMRTFKWWGFLLLLLTLLIWGILLFRKK